MMHIEKLFKSLLVITVDLHSLIILFTIPLIFILNDLLALIAHARPLKPD